MPARGLAGRTGPSGMATWRNWSGRQSADSVRLEFVRSEAQLAALLRAAADSSGTVRVAGAGHSHAPLVPTDGSILDLSGFAGITHADPDAGEVWIRSGTQICTLGRALHDLGLALGNQGDIDRQTLGGAIATGTHGTGPELQNLSAMVIGLRLVTAAGEPVECDAERERDLWQAARLGLGALGVITEVRLAVVPAFRLKEAGFRSSWPDFAARLDAHIRDNERFEFFWYPRSDEVLAKPTNRTEAAAEYPLAPEGARVAWSYEVLSNHRPARHTEMEYSLPAEQGPACFGELRRLFRERFGEMAWPVEYRTLAADEVWLSTAYRRPTVTLSVHQGAELDEEPCFSACEEIFLAFGGRPHWGKLHYLSGAQLAELYPEWENWWRVRDGWDPQGRFLNETLAAWRP